METENILQAALLLGVLLYALSPAGAVDQYVQIENVRVVPSSILPGDTFNISFDVRNMLTDDLKYLYVRFASDANFKVLGSDTWAYQGTVPKREKVTASFLLKVSRDTLADVYSLPFLVTSESKIITAATGVGSIYATSVSITQTLYASVEVSGRARLVLSLSGSQPGMIEAGGKEALVTLKVFNNGGDTAKDVLLVPRDTEFLKVGSASGSIFLGEIKPRSSATATVSLQVPSGASGKYVLPVGLTFSDKRDSYDESVGMEIKVADRALFSVLHGRIALVAGRNDQRIGVRLQNDGNVAAEDVDLTLVAEYPLTTSGRTSFIQRLEPGEQDTAYFTLDVDSKAAEQKYPAELLISWREGENPLSASRRFAVEVSEGKTTFAYGAVIAGLIAVILGAVLYGRRWWFFAAKKKAKNRRA